MAPLILMFLLAGILNTVLLIEYWIFTNRYFCEFAEVAKFAK